MSRNGCPDGRQSADNHTWGPTSRCTATSNLPRSQMSILSLSATGSPRNLEILVSRASTAAVIRESMIQVYLIAGWRIDRAIMDAPNLNGTVRAFITLTGTSSRGVCMPLLQPCMRQTAVYISVIQRAAAGELASRQVVLLFNAPSTLWYEIASRASPPCHRHPVFHPYTREVEPAAMGRHDQQWDQ